MNLLYVALGGAIGASARYLVNGWLGTWLGAGFPWGTFFVNVSGSFFIGVVLVLVEGGALSAGTRAFLAVGILGGYTTFSTFTYESLGLLTNIGLLLMLLNVLGQITLGLIFVYLGLLVGRLVGGV